MKAKAIANVILAIVDDEKRFVRPDPEEWADACGTAEELRMQLREVAFALVAGKEITGEDLF